MNEPSSPSAPTAKKTRKRGSPKGALVIERSGHALAYRVTVAARLTQRVRGMMFRPPLADGDGFMLERCNSIHTAFVRSPIDVVFLTERLRVLRIEHSLPPFRVRWPVRGAKRVLELAGGACEAAGLREGDRLTHQRTQK